MSPIALVPVLFIIAGLLGICRNIYSLLKLRQHLIALVPEPEKAQGFHGHFSKDLTKSRAQLLSWVNSKPKICRLNRAFIPTVCVCHPETISQLFASNPPKFWYVMDFLKEFLGDGLINSTGLRWHRDRKLLSPLFGGTMLRKYVQDLSSVAKTMVDQFTIRSADNELFDGESIFQLVTFDAIMRCMLGVDIDSWTNAKSSPVEQYKHAVKYLAQESAKRPTNPVLHSNFIYYLTSEGRKYTRQLSIANAFADNIIEERRGTLASRTNPDGACSDGVSACNMLDIMLKAEDEDGNGLSNTDIRHHVNTFLEAGHDTTSTVMQWAVYYLQEHQDIQERCRQEIQTVLGDSGLERLSLDDLSQMEYLLQFINETLRHASVTPLLFRRLDKETEIGGYVLPAGTPIQVLLFSLHHNPLVWKDPEAFDPSRFSPERTASRLSNSFFPFGVGARNCIGRQFAITELKILICSVLLSFRILPRRKSSEEIPAWVPRLVARPEPGIKFQLELLQH
eukprot:scpid57204/ scgid1663/ Leukotriene-B(4) omega-hydroxylase 1; CYPIVF2; Cytochrome P450 4F2; Cytochrome P450-LTB-omega; Leukotriene-B(4) 20-monooxygenase 1